MRRNNRMNTELTSLLDNKKFFDVIKLTTNSHENVLNEDI
jgi:hypothetical protein